MTARYHCGDEERRSLVAASALNGIDFIEVVDSEAPTEALRQKLLALHCLKAVAGLTVDHARLEGGVRILDVKVLWAFPLDSAPGDLAGLEPEEQQFFADYLAGAPDRDRILILRTNSDGDFSTYRLVLEEPGSGGSRPAGFDPRLSSVEFSFKAECSSDFDCKQVSPCPPGSFPQPPIDYLAKDYGSFRRLIFDRMAALAPQWQERNPADQGVALVELMAYTADRLSYFQDAVATEAYLGTARRRVSVRRHARLVDYPMHDGCNARCWVHLTLEAGAPVVLPGPDPVTGTPGTALGTGVEGLPTVAPPHRVEKAAAAGAVIFETLHDVTLREAHNELRLYTWGNRECCLPAGATEATLVAEAGLEAGMFLLFEEVLGPRTGAAADADPRHRHVVRLNRVSPTTDPLNSLAVAEVAWDAADALPFPLCISARTDPAHGARFVENVSIARGNLVLADAGLTIQGEALPPVPAGGSAFEPVLEEGPVTQAAPLPAAFQEPGDTTPAAAFFAMDPTRAMPSVQLSGAGEIWRPRRDLLASDRFQTEMVVEVDDDERAHLRFGNDVQGARPAAGEVLTARYRVGNGSRTNIGADSLAHVFVDQPAVLAVRNPLAADGGHDPESKEEVRQLAPQAFRVQQRAVTEADYAEVAERFTEVQRAAATFRWTGSWTTVFLTVDRTGGLPVDAAFEERLRGHMERFRMAGQDLEIDAPRFAPLDLALRICVLPDYFRSDVRQALLQTFSNTVLPDGRRGFFHPDEWTFGQPLYLSQLFQAAAAVDGVESVEVTRFQRLGRPAVAQDLDDGVLPLERLEIVRMDNDPNFQENGRMEFVMGGGR